MQRWKGGVRPVYKYNPDKEYNRKHRLQYKCQTPIVLHQDPRPQDDRRVEDGRLRRTKW